MTKDEAARIVNFLQEAYAGYKYYNTPNAAAAWYVVLEHLTYEQVRSAVLDIVREGKIKPTPADIAKRYPAAKREEPEQDYRPITREQLMMMLNYLWPDIPAKFSNLYDELLDYRRRHGYDA